jgi:hypothetical protein
MRTVILAYENKVHNAVPLLTQQLFQKLSDGENFEGYNIKVTRPMLRGIYNT